VTAAIPLHPAPSPWRSVWLSWFLPCSGICVALFDVLVAVGWYAHWEAVVRVAAGMPAMKINAAVGFVLCGIAVGDPRQRCRNTAAHLAP
jgi:hypothetical protein